MHPNDRLLDGTVKAITADSIVIVQDVNDPLSLDQAAGSPQDPEGGRRDQVDAERG